MEWRATALAMRTTFAYPQELPAGVELLRDIQYGDAGGALLWMDIAKPKQCPNGEPLPALVYMHGGAWQSGSKADGVPAICYYAMHGYVAASIGYRLSGAAQFPAQVEDCKCATRFLRAKARELSIDPERIGAMGASSGGHLAALLGLTGGDSRSFASKGGWEDYSDRVAAVCDLFGPADFMQMPRKHLPEAMSATAQFLGGTIDRVPERYVKASPVTHVHAKAPPFLIVHGELDPLVPLHQSELLRDALLKAGVEVSLHVVKGAGHGSSNVITPTVRSLILAFFDRHLKPIEVRGVPGRRHCGGRKA